MEQSKDNNASSSGIHLQCSASVDITAVHLSNLGIFSFFQDNSRVLPFQMHNENPDEFTGLSVACNYLEVTDINTKSSAPSAQSLELSSNLLTHIKEFVFKDYCIWTYFLSRTTR
jgi:hypothetical protein